MAGKIDFSTDAERFRAEMRQGTPAAISAVLSLAAGSTDPSVREDANHYLSRVSVPAS